MKLYLEDFRQPQLGAKAQDDAKAMAAALDCAKAQSEPCTLCLPKDGVIHIYKDFCPVREYHTSNTDSTEYPQKTFGILLEDMHDFTLDGQGCQILFHGDLCAIGVVRCKNIGLENFSWDFESPSTSQLTVLKSTPCTVTFQAAKGCTYEIEDGRHLRWIGSVSPYTNKPYYIQYDNHESWSAVGYDPETGIQRRRSFSEAPFQRVRRIEPLAEDIFKIHYLGLAPRVWRKAGMVAQLCASKHRPTAGAFFWESENIVVKRVTVHYMHGFGWLTQMCKNIAYLGCRFEPNADGRYCTSYADLLHVSGAGGKILIEDCAFSHAHDDPINIHGTFTRVEKLLNADTAVLRYVHRQQGGFPQFHAGDAVAFYRRDTLEPLAGKEELYTVVRAGAPGEDGNDMKSMTVQFDRPLPQGICDKIGTEPCCVAENVTYTPEVTVRGCTFDHIPTRGILCTTRKKVLIEKNRFDHLAMACIFISNDSNEWYESGPVRNMTIRENEFFIRPTGQTEWKDTPAVYVHPVVKAKHLPSTPVHRNITIENNTVHLFHDKAFVLESVDGVTLKNNTVLREGKGKGSVCTFTGCQNVDSDLA